MRILGIIVTIIILQLDCLPDRLAGRGDGRARRDSVGASPTAVADDAPAGDAAHGEDIFTHGVGDAPSLCELPRADANFRLGPDLHGVVERAGQRVPGLTADEYMHQSILHPSDYLVPGYGNLMYPRYSSVLSEQDVADLIAFLHTLG